MRPQTANTHSEWVIQRWSNAGTTSLMLAWHWINAGPRGRIFQTVGTYTDLTRSAYKYEQRDGDNADNTLIQYAHLQSQKAVTAHFSRQQLRPFGFIRQKTVIAYLKSYQLRPSGFARLNTRSLGVSLHWRWFRHWTIHTMRRALRLDQSRRRWTIVKTTLIQPLVSAG